MNFLVDSLMLSLISDLDQKKAPFKNRQWKLSPFSILPPHPTPPPHVNPFCRFLKGALHKGGLPLPNCINWIGYICWSSVRLSSAIWAADDIQRVSIW